MMERIQSVASRPACVNSATFRCGSRLLVCSDWLDSNSLSSSFITRPVPENHGEIPAVRSPVEARLRRRQARCRSFSIAIPRRTWLLPAPRRLRKGPSRRGRPCCSRPSIHAFEDEEEEQGLLNDVIPGVHEPILFVSECLSYSIVREGIERGLEKDLLLEFDERSRGISVAREEEISSLALADGLTATSVSVDLPSGPQEPSLLPCLQVESSGEQDALAATPAHPAALQALYSSYFFNCFIEHSWKFACPALLSLINDSLLPVALFSFASQLVVFFASPFVGELMDSAPRVVAFNTLSIVQTCAMIATAAATIHGLTSPRTLLASTSSSTSSSLASLLSRPWFLVLLLAGAAERVTGLASGVAFERDWVVQLAGPNRPLALANANAVLRRVDMMCEVIGPVAFGWLLSSFPPMVCLRVAITMMTLSLPVLLVCVAATDYFSRGVLGKQRSPAPGPSQPPQPQHQQQHEQQQLTVDAHPEPPSTHSSSFSRAWALFLSHPVLPASIAYVLLAFNAVLSPGGLMTSFLTQRGIDVSVIGMFRGACAIMGFSATFISSPMIAKLGVLQTGACALLFQATVLVLSVVVFFLAPPSSQPLLMLFLALVVLSRLGQWTYDVVDAQIFQTAIPAKNANIIGSTEISLMSLAELAMLAVAIVVHDVRHFGVLAAVSALSVLASTGVYCSWVVAPTPAQQRLFPSESHVMRKWMLRLLGRQGEIEGDGGEPRQVGLHPFTPVPLTT